MFSSYIVWYLFLAGTGGGAFLVAVFSHAQNYRDSSCEKEFLTSGARAGFFTAAGSLVFACLLLALDLGVPDQAIQILFNPFESLISVGAWFVGGATLLSVSIVAIFVAFPQFQRLFFIMACFGSLLSIATMSYTGLLLSSMVAVDFWNTPLLVLLFIISSLSCGIAATSLVEKFFLGKSNGSFYSGFSAWLTVGEGLVLVAFLASRWFVSETGRQSCELLLSGNFSIVFWVGLIAVGLLLPLVLHGLRRLLDTQALEIISCIGVLVGGVCLRYCVIGAGLHSQLTI